MSGHPCQSCLGRFVRNGSENKTKIASRARFSTKLSLLSLRVDDHRELASGNFWSSLARADCGKGSFSSRRKSHVKSPLQGFTTQNRAIWHHEMACHDSIRDFLNSLKESGICCACQLFFYCYRYCLSAPLRQIMQ